MGADPHKRALTATVLDNRGGIIGTRSFRVSGDGHRELEAWATSHGRVRRWGIEGASGLGRHTSIYLVRQGYDVRDVNPGRTAEQSRKRRQGKTDALDALRIGRELQADPDMPVAFKRAEGDVGPDERSEQLTLWHKARRWAVDQRRQLLNQAESLLCELPEQARAGLPDQPDVRARLGALAKRDRSPTWDAPTALRLQLLDGHIAAIAALDAQEQEAAAALAALVQQSGSTLGGALRPGPALGGRTTGRGGRPPPLCWRRRLRPLQRDCAIARIICRGRRRACPPPPRPRREPAGERSNLPHGGNPKRCDQRAQAIYDDGRVWPHEERIHAGPKTPPLKCHLPPPAPRPSPRSAARLGPTTNSELSTTRLLT